MLGTSNFSENKKRKASTIVYPTTIFATARLESGITASTYSKVLSWVITPHFINQYFNHIHQETYNCI